MRHHKSLSAGIVILLFASASPVMGDGLWVGTASVEITPDRPVAIAGQFHLRISRGAGTPITANALVLEQRRGGRAAGLAIMVSCDLVSIPDQVLADVRRRVKAQLPDLDTRKIFLSGTHTHAAPELRRGKFLLPAQGVMTPGEYQAFLGERVAAAIVTAWQGRSPGRIAWGLGHAAVACNRRAVYADGSARMYGATNVPAFRGLEGYEDHDVGVLFVWNAAGDLVGAAVNVSCPSQEEESGLFIHADFWHPVRASLRKRYGDQLCVLGWSGAAGDQSPHLMIRKAAEERMRKLRGLTRMEEIARRIVRAVIDTHGVVERDRRPDVPIVHAAQAVRLPMRLVTQAEYAEAKKVVAQCAALIAKDPKAADSEHRRMKWYERTVQRFEEQKVNPGPTFETELHAVRIGDVVVCTNPFELFTEFGIRIKGRSKAVQTFIVQLAGPGSYLPTARAVRGGHYSAIVHSSLVGPEGGQVLVDRTVAMIDALWAPSLKKTALQKSAGDR